MLRLCNIFLFLFLFFSFNSFASNIQDEGISSETVDWVFNKSRIEWREFVFNKRDKGETLEYLDKTILKNEKNEIEKISYTIPIGDAMPFIDGEEIITLAPEYKNDIEPESLRIQIQNAFKAEEWKGTDYYKICDKIEKKTRKNLSGKYSFLFFCDLFFQSNFYFNTNVEFWIDKEN